MNSRVGVAVASSSKCRWASTSASNSGHHLRGLMRSTAQPVAVISVCLPLPSNNNSTTGPPNHGATLSSLSSISLTPPLVGFSLRLPSRLATYLLNPSSSSPRLRIHVLSGTQEHAARTFARQAPLPAPASPSPPPSTAKLEDPSFSSTVFGEVEKNALGTLFCTMVHSVPLASLDPGAGVTEKNGPRSELFIAKVDEVKLSASGHKGVGSLVYWEQGYHVVGSQ